MRDGGRIALGALVAFAFLGLPVLWNVHRPAPAPKPDLDTPVIRALPEKQCVEPTPYMREQHMQLLKFWRDSVVRANARTYVSSGGAEFEMSLQKTCMNCHSNKQRFCDQCHDYIALKLTCFDCHVAPENSP